MKKLSEAVQGEGYCLIVGDWRTLAEMNPAIRPLGAPADHVAVCEGGLIICPSDSWDYAYSAAHEIAEASHQFEHSADMFADQANILAKWLRRVTAEVLDE